GRGGGGGGGGRLAGDERAQAGVGGDHLRAGEAGGRIGVVDRLEQVVDVAALGANLVLRPGPSRGVGRAPVGVGGADDGARAVGQGEDQPPIAGRVDDDGAAAGGQPGGVEHDVHAQGGPQRRGSAPERIGE